MKASAEIISEADGKATVVIHTTYFDESSLDADAFFSAKEDARHKSFASTEEQISDGHLYPEFNHSLP